MDVGAVDTAGDTLTLERDGPRVVWVEGDGVDVVVDRGTEVR